MGCEEAEKSAQEIEPERAIFTAASTREGAVGFGMYCRDGQIQLIQRSRVGLTDQVNSYYGELMAVRHTYQIIHDL